MNTKCLCIYDIRSKTKKKKKKKSKNAKSLSGLTQRKCDYCCFFCTVEEVSFSKAAYETCKLIKALRPMYRITMKTKAAISPMKIPMIS